MTATTAGNSFSPLRQPVFVVLWAATVLGNTGSFMRDVASSWLMTDLSASPVAVAMVQAAGTLPIFLLAIPAGVLTDVLDKRRLLIAIQLLLAAASCTLMVLAHLDLLSVSSLLSLTLLGGVGAALMGPTWQAIVPELVPREDLKNAVALNSVGINIARSIGPAAGGLLLVTFGAAITYGADVASYLIVIAALIWWPRPKKENDALAEGFIGAFRAGLRYTKASQPLHIILLRAGIFFAFSSCVWALLPLVARQLLNGDAGFYGMLLGAVGAGAIIGAVVMPSLRDRFDSDALLFGAAVVAASVMGGLSLAPPKWLAVAILLFLGGAWITALTTLNATAQSVLPNWVRGRGLAVYITVFNGAMTVGSLCWGGLGQAIGLPMTLVTGAASLLVAGVLMHRLKLPIGDKDLVPSNHWPEPLVREPVAYDRGPVLILVEYRIEQNCRVEFLQTLHALSQERRKDGAYNWGVTEDAADPEKIVEWFTVESWAEHLRQHHRVSKADADLQAKLVQHHPGVSEPFVRHLVTISR